MLTWEAEMRFKIFVIAAFILSGLGQAGQAGELPRVLVGQADLICDISARANGIQRLMVREGGGLSFAATVSPLVDGIVEQRGSEKGALYSFTSKLAKPARGTLSGIGDVSIEELSTKVSVTINRYDQEKAGGTLRFVSGDLINKDVYVEFSGVAVNGKDRYEFNINMGPVLFGSGSVQPASANYRTTLDKKAVTLHAKTTTVVARMN